MVGEFEREELPHSFPSRRCTSEENSNLKGGSRIGVEKAEAQNPTQRRRTMNAGSEKEKARKSLDWPQKV